MSALDKWLSENKFGAYADKFKAETDGLESLSAEVLETDEDIKSFIQEEIGESKKLKAKKIFNAIKKLQKAIAAESEKKEDSKAMEKAIQKYGFDVNELVQIREEAQIMGFVKSNMSVVKRTEKQYYDINVTEAMTKLANCGKLIQLAYASSNGFACQAKVVLLLSKYGTLVKDSFIASSKFVNASLDSLANHKIALQILKKKPDKSLVFLGKCGKLAETMAVVAGELVAKSEFLALIAEEALTIAVSDKSMTDEKREQIQQKIAEAKAQNAKLISMTAQLAQQVQQIKEDEAKVSAEAKAERDKGFWKDVVSSVLAPIGQIAAMNPVAQVSKTTNAVVSAIEKGSEQKTSEAKAEDLGNQVSAAKTLDDKAWLLTQQKYEVQNNLIEQNAALAQTVSELGSLGNTENKLERALKAIEITIKTLGKIKVIFSNTKVFWEGVQANCDKLVKIGENVQGFKGYESEVIPQIREAITDSALSWFVLCKVNYFAKNAISLVDKGMDEILNDLPDESEALTLVDELSKTMKLALDEEIKAIKAANDEEAKDDQ